MTNYASKTSPSDENKYNQLIAYEDFIFCNEKYSAVNAENIEKSNVLKAKKRIAQISEQTQNSQYPDILYFNWSRDLNPNAISNFLKQEGTQSLENPTSQFNLATYYLKADPEKSLRILLHTLELYQPGEKINTDIFISIVEIYTKKEDIKAAYLWSKVLELFEPNNEKLKKGLLKSYISDYEINDEFLNKVALITKVKIDSGSFRAPKS